MVIETQLQQKSELVSSLGCQVMQSNEEHEHMLATFNAQVDELQAEIAQHIVDGQQTNKVNYNMCCKCAAQDIHSDGAHDATQLAALYCSCLLAWLLRLPVRLSLINKSVLTYTALLSPFVSAD